MRQPSPCVRALCETGILFTCHIWSSTSHFALLTAVFTLHTTHFTLHTSHCTLHTAPFAVNTSLHAVLLRLHTSHFTLHTSHSTLHTSHSTLHTSHCTLRTPNFTLHTPHFTLHTSQSTLHTSHFSLLPSRSKLHTSHFTLHSSRPTLHTALFTLHTSSHLSSPHLIPQLISSHLSSSQMSSKLSWITSQYYYWSLSQPWCTHPNTIYEVQLQKTKVLRMQPRQEAPWRSHYNAICRDWVAKHNRTTRNGVGNCSSKTGWISTPNQKKNDFEALFKSFLKRKITSAKTAKICWQITVAAWMQPLQYDLRSSAAKDNSITHAAAAPMQH